MPTEEIKQLETHMAGPRSAEPLTHWGRPLAVTAAVLFFVSSVFPVAAGLTKDTASFSLWWGRVDVALAFVLVILAFAIITLSGNKVSPEAADASYRAYRILNHGILALIVVFFLFGDRITWTHCLTGFAWRAWLLVYSLPAWFTALRAAPAH